LLHCFVRHEHSEKRFIWKFEVFFLRAERIFILVLAVDAFDAGGSACGSVINVSLSAHDNANITMKLDMNT